MICALCEQKGDKLELDPDGQCFNLECESNADRRCSTFGHGSLVWRYNRWVCPLCPVPEILAFSDNLARDRILQTQGHKDDAGKPRFDLIPMEVMLELAKLYTLGAKKYDDHNWKKGLSYSRTHSAMMRHFVFWWLGEDIDPDNGQHHLDSVIWNAIALRYFELHRDKYKQFDDRPIGDKTCQDDEDPVTRSAEPGAVDAMKR